MAGASREHGLSLLAAANNHGDLAVKLSSLKQVKDILLSVDSSVVAELFPYLVELQTSPECLVRKALVEAMEEIGSKKMEHCYILIPIILAYLKDSDTVVAKQSIISGTNLFCHILEELSLQFHQHGKVEKWLEELWTRMIRFKDSIIDIVCEPGPVGTRLLGMKFLETCVLLFTSDSNNSEKPTAEVVRGSRKAFNISWLVGGHPILDSVALMSEANRSLGILLDLLRSSSSLPASLTITVVNCLAAIARKRPLRYNTVLSALLDFHMNIEMGNGGHTASVFYSIRTALLGFLRCTYTPIVESRDTLLRSLRAMNAGDAADQVIRQVDKMIRYNERAPRDVRMSKDDSSSSQQALLVDLSKKRSLFLDNEEQTNGYEGASKRIHYGPNSQLAVPAEPSDSGQDYVPVNGQASKVPLLENVLTPIEQMITMIGALIAEGERGAQSLEILISNIQPDLLADIVITNMKHLPKNLLQLTRPGNLPINRQIDTLSSPMQVASSTLPAMSVNSSVLTAQVSSSPVTAISTSVHDLPVNADSKRDPRRDPRRLDPRRAAVTVEAPPTPIMEDTGVGQPEINGSVSLNKPHSLGMPSVENISVPTIAKAKSDDEGLRSPMVLETDQQTLEDDTLERIKEVVSTEITSSNLVPSPVCALDEGLDASKPSDITKTDGVDALSLMESDQQSPTISNTSASEETCHDLPPLPLYVESTDEQKITVKRLAVERIIDSCRHLWSADFSQTRMAVLARLVAQMDANEDAILMLQKNITLDYQQQKGHELVLQILYHLHTIIMSDSIEHSSFATAVYDKFLLAVVKSLLDNFPASDKSFSRLLGEIPLFPDSALKLLEDLCYADIYDHRGKEIRDVDRVTQGLGAVWSLILGRPPYRQACLNIALKSAVHSQDEICSRAIRLVANKLYMLSYIRENIEQYATNMLLSAVDQEVSETDFSHPGSSEQRMDMEVGSQETSISGSQFSEPGASENDSVKGAKPVLRSPSNALSRQAQCLISLYFALCTKKASLLQLVFDIYGRAPKIVKQAFCRHIPILVRALGSSCSELLRIISDPPQGSEDLLSQVLQVLTEGTTPSPDLIAIVKHLYETKLKDASILIPMLSSLSKNEVIPIFPRLVDLPLEKFQLALANILQGSAHTGPALTPAEVLVAIHDITPEKDGLPIKKITDVCSACFEQRTVFTQQVLARALNHMVDQTPLPLLFMRTVIQAIDAFPTLVDFVMEILSKLVSKQLPPPPLESALNRHANLRGSLAAYASQPSIKSSLPRSILAVLGIANG